MPWIEFRPDKMLAAIVSDCGVALYSNKWWARRSNAEWDEIITEARRTGYGYTFAIERYRDLTDSATIAFAGTENQRYSYSGHQMFKKVRTAARYQHREVYEWFKQRGKPQKRKWHEWRKAKSRTYLDVIPADIRGIIDDYLRVNYNVPKCIITAIMGLRHSFNDAPSAIYPTNLAWHKLGRLHRDGDPAVVACSATDGLFRWYTNGVAGRPNHSYITITYTIKDRITYATHSDTGSYHFNCHLDDPATVSEISRLRAAHLS